MNLDSELEKTLSALVQKLQRGEDLTTDEMKDLVGIMLYMLIQIGNIKRYHIGNIKRDHM